MTLKFTTSFLEDAIGVFQRYKKLAEAAMTQVSEEQLAVALDEESNSIAIIVKHMAGNMLSRWTDFLTTDGEKPWRDRDSEFEVPPANREGLMALWERGWGTLFEALNGLTEADLARTVMIRSEAHSVMQAVNRQLAHYPYHCGQIVFIAKHLAREKWNYLSVPRGRSQEFNAQVVAGKISQR
ncbi:DUF1572 domain-containing protein [Acidicapsa dinghuensis]|uniref:DUF1572 domain-containing protein n=1 Tax=Acidicapsa dinghuensis TaxID=2218256 RepID=A0ABW1ELJ8_9BACT|nr:DUF1572 domain-containing protein [Acidicapsa dinghuensis]